MLKKRVWAFPHLDADPQALQVLIKGSEVVADHTILKWVGTGNKTDSKMELIKDPDILGLVKQ